MLKRFLSKVQMTHSCWIWKASAKNQFGHGSFSVGNKRKFAHRVSYELFVGPIPEGKCVLHTCDNPRCVNPGHLFIGTKKDNIKDALLKGRMKSWGKGAPKAILLT